MANHNWFLVYLVPKPCVIPISSLLIGSVQSYLRCVSALQEAVTVAVCLSVAFVFPSCIQLLSDQWNALSTSRK